MNAALAEVIRIGFHGEAVKPDDWVLLFREPCPGQDAIRHKVLPGAVGLHDGLYDVVGHIAVVRQQLLGVLWEAVAAVAKGGVVIMRANPGIQAHAGDDVPGVQAPNLGIGVQFIEETHPQRQIGVGEQLDCFSFGGVHQ